jgi:hypothetical protein
MLHTRIIERIRSEYLEMPGLRLTPTQAERLCGVELTLCKAVLDALVDAKFLTVTATGLYVRTTDGAPPPNRPGQKQPRRVSVPRT